MNKIIKSLSVIAFVGAVALAATGAYFSDDAVSESNSFIAGTLDLKLANPEDPFTNSITGTFHMDDMVPGGAETTGVVWLENNGTVLANHVRITSVVNTPSDNGINEPECKAYGGEWLKSGSHHYCIKVSNYDDTTCGNVGGSWDSGYWGCYTRDDGGFKDDWGSRNDIDKYLQVTSIKYNNGAEKVGAYSSTVTCAGELYDFNENGWYDLDDVERGPWTKDGCVLDRLTPAPGTSGNSPRKFEMTVKLHEDTTNHYQTDKNGIKITFMLNQDLSQ